MGGFDPQILLSLFSVEGVWLSNMLTQTQADTDQSRFTVDVMFQDGDGYIADMATELTISGWNWKLFFLSMGGV